MFDCRPGVQLIVALATTCSAFGQAPGTPAAKTGNAGLVQFAEKHCFDCHGNGSDAAAVENPLPDADRPTGIPTDYGAHIRLMYDLMVMAFQSQTTSVASFLTAHDGSNRSFKDIGVAEGHHHLSHHRDDAKKVEKIARIDKFYADR